MMNISSSNLVSLQFNTSALRTGSGCPTPHSIDGTKLKNTVHGYDTFQTPVEQGTAVFIDRCGGYSTVKALPNFKFYMLAQNETPSSFSDDTLQALLDHNICVVEPLLQVVQRERQESFYDRSGQLINKKFSTTNLTPEKMAAAGFHFVGDEDTDSVSCLCHRDFLISRWESNDIPAQEHRQHHGMEAAKLSPAYPSYRIEAGTNTVTISSPDSIFALKMPTQDTSGSKLCNRAIVTILDHEKLPTITKDNLDKIVETVQQQKIQQTHEKNISQAQEALNTLSLTSAPDTEKLEDLIQQQAVIAGAIIPTDNQILTAAITGISNKLIQEKDDVIATIENYNDALSLLKSTSKQSNIKALSNILQAQKAEIQQLIDQYEDGCFKNNGINLFVEKNSGRYSEYTDILKAISAELRGLLKSAIADK